MAYVNVLSGVSSSLAALAKPAKKKTSDSNSNIDIVSTELTDVHTYLQHFAAEQSKFATKTTSKLSKIEKDVEYIAKRISPKIFTIGKGKNEQSVKYDPLAPEGRQVTLLTQSGKSGRIASKKGGATSEYNQALSKAAYSSNNEMETTPVKPKMAAVGSSREERAALYKRLSFEMREDDPVYLLKTSMEENFKKVFGILDEIMSKISSLSNSNSLPEFRRRRIPRKPRKPTRFRRNIRGLKTGLGLTALTLGTQYALGKYNEYRRSDPNRESGDVLSDIGVNLGVGGAVNGFAAYQSAKKVKSAFKTMRAAERLRRMREVNPNALRATSKQKTIWKLFLSFLEKRAPKLFAKIGARLVGSAYLAGIPVVGWALMLGIDSVFLISTLYDVYQLWLEFNNLSESERQQFNTNTNTDAIGQAKSSNSSTPAKDQPKPEPKDIPQQQPKDIPQQQSQSLELTNIPAGDTGTVSEQTDNSYKGMGKDISKYVTKSDPSINIDGLNPILKDRFAAMAKDYYDLTKKKIQVNSGLRTYQQQAALYKKLGPGKAAKPGFSRHESGLAIDIQSTDGNKLQALGLLKKYGFVRPVMKEAWHVEPKETAKRGGGIPDNPNNPGAPIAVSDKSGKPVSPDTGKKLSQFELDKTAKTNLETDSSAGNVSAQTPADSPAPPPELSAADSSSSKNTTADLTPDSTTAPAEQISSVPPTPTAAAPTPTAAAPAQMASGTAISNQSADLEQNKLAAAVQPVVNNVIPMAPPVQCRFQPQNPASLPEASINNSDDTIKTMFTRDRWA